MEKIRRIGVDLTLKARVRGEVGDWIKEKRFYGEKCNITSTALEFYHDYLFYKKGFLIKMIQDNFEEVKHLLRKIGRAKEDEKMPGM